MRKLFTLSLLLAAIIPAFAQQQNLTVEQIFSGQFSSRLIFGLNPMKNGTYYSALDTEGENQLINQYSYITGEKVKTLVNVADIGRAIGKDNLRIDSYEFSSDEQQVLVTTGTEHIYRHSTRAFCYVWNIAQQKATQVGSGKLMYASFNSIGDKVAFVRDNNLFLYTLATNAEAALTSDGQKNAVINGATDWVYEEEFGLSQGYQWSPDGQMLAFYRFDESQVKEFSMDIYGSLYPEQDRFKYPKAGEANSFIQLYLYQVSNGKLSVLDIGTETDIYIPRIHWAANNSALYIQRLNRLQNKLDILSAKPADEGKTQLIYTESNAAFIDIYDLLPLQNGDFVLQSEKDGYNHLYLLNSKGKVQRQLTKGAWEVEKLVGVDEKKGLVYFESSMGKAIDLKLYSVTLKGAGLKELTPAAGVNTIVFNSDYTYFIDTRSTFNEPYKITLHEASGKQIRELENNSKLQEKLKGYAMGPHEFFQFTTGENVTLNGWMIKPANFDPAKKYPVLMYVYGGPGRNTVVNSWGGANYLWFQLLAEKGYVVVSVDNRGTGSRGAAFRKATYMQLGKLETQDQIEANKYLGTLPYIDKTRIGMFGWSYGGYMSSLCISKGAGYFKTAIAVAPVTNWRYYDNIYTERYMRKPQENGQGYDDNSPISHVKEIKGNFLIIHGTADDNVHFQNTVEMVDKMIREGVKFDSEFYPNKNHGIGGTATRIHLFNRMTDYLLQNL